MMVLEVSMNAIAGAIGRFATRAPLRSARLVTYPAAGARTTVLCKFHCAGRVQKPAHYQTSTPQTLDERRIFNGTASPPEQTDFADRGCVVANTHSMSAQHQRLDRQHQGLNPQQQRVHKSGRIDDMQREALERTEFP